MSRPNEPTEGNVATPGPLALAPDEVHLWHAWTAQAEGPALAERFRRLLSDEEMQRLYRYRLERVRHEFLVARALVRTVLSRYASVDPRDWSFDAGPWGKPRLAGPWLEQPLHFNLSHTRGLVVCAVAREVELGVDVEQIERKTSLVSLAHRYFAPLEVHDLFELPPAQQASGFFDYWTLKESYIKARGQGLSIPLAAFAFDLADRQRIRIACEPELGDDQEHWWFGQYDPSPAHRAAVAVRWHAIEPPRVSRFETMPTETAYRRLG